MSARGRLRSWPCLAAALALASPVLAADGALPISQACAATGCFAGDVPGFPVTVTSAGSYVLTSNLAVGNPTTSAIVITADDVDLDLHGFEVAGPVTCTGQGSTLSCTFSGSAGRGIDAGAGQRTSVRDGFVRGFAAAGIATGEGGRLQDLSVDSIAGSGITVGTESRVSESVVSFSGNGIAAGDGAIVERSVVLGSLQNGIVTGAGGAVIECVAHGSGLVGITAGLGTLVRRSVSNGSQADGIQASFGGQVSESIALTSGQDGIQASTGSSVQRCVVGSSFGGYGLRLTSASYRESTIRQGAGPGTVLGGIDMGANSCNGTSACP